MIPCKEKRWAELRYTAGLSYNFNVSGSKYKGTGAGNEEKSRL